MATTTATRTTAPTRRSASTDELALLRTVLIGALIVLIPVASARFVWTSVPGELDFNRSVVVAPFDLALVGLIALCILTGRARTLVRRPRSLGRLLAWTLGALAVLSFAANPSPRGVELAVRVLGGIAVVDTFQQLPRRHRHRLLAVFLAVGAAQSVLALLQSARGEPFGIDFLDYDGMLYQFGSSHAGRGGLTHPYHLVVFLLVALAGGLVGLAKAGRPQLWLIGLAACGAGIGVGYSRSSLLALGPAAALVLVVAFRSSRRTLAYGVLAAAIAFFISALAFGDGWYARYEHSTGETAASGRTVQWRDALDMAADHPALGVGPGRYTIAMSERSFDGELLPAHNVVLHLAAELGALGGALGAALGCAVVVALGRRGPLALLPIVVLAPFYLLDAYPYMFATGLAVTALAGAIALHAAEQAQTTENSRT